MNPSNPAAELAAFAAGLRFEHLPAVVVRRAEDLFVDWFGSAVGGHGARAVESVARFAQAMGGTDGPAEVIVSRARTSPLLAAMANAAASHVAEQDDVHNGSVFHPATVVFPPAIAVAQALGASGRQLLTAAVAGYEVGIRVGEFLGRSHYKAFHTTGTAGTLAAAAAVGQLLNLTAGQMRHAFGSAGTQSAGLWEFLRTAADSKQLHTAHAAGAGLMAAYLAKDGFTGADRIFDGAQGMAAGMSSDADPHKLVDGLGTRWATVETSFKFHASCRHTHPAADALALVMREHRLQPADIARVLGRAPEAAAPQPGAPRVSGSLEAHYAPRTPLQLVSSDGLLFALRNALVAGEKVAVLAPTAQAISHDLVSWKQSPAEPAGFAHDLYASLRELDALGCARILVQQPPAGEAWLAVNDRLRRAAAGSGEDDET